MIDVDINDAQFEFFLEPRRDSFGPFNESVVLGSVSGNVA